ncbi:MAG: AarF/ABC1/UbiB kinase family protein [Thermodesulfobacteriota bacterium]
MAANTDNNKKGLPLDKVIQAIPEGITDAAEGADPLRELISQISTRKIPVNSLTRLWALGSMQAKVAVGYLAYAMRSSFSNKTEKQKRLNEAHLKAALKLLGTMGYLRGAVMKIGQLLSNMPHVVPDEISETLERLQFEAPPMHYSLIREVFLDEFGQEPSEIFASFDKKAFAAASLGQVHRATLNSGEEVAVKIQYPSMASTIRSDIANLKKILLPMKLKKESRYIFGHLSDVETVLVGETDYLEEARFMIKAREFFDPEDEIVVPKVWEEYSTDRVLTTDFLTGKHAADFLKTNPEQSSRDHFGILISRAILRIWGRAKTLYADPNPGNFLFLDDNRLGLLDFGCCRTLSTVEWKFQVQAETSLLNGDHEIMNRLIASATLFKGPEEMEPERLELMINLSKWQAEPAMKPGVFNFGDREYYQRGIDLYMEATRKGYIRNNSIYIWWTRLIFGHRTLLYRLGSKIDYHQIYMDERNY